MKASLKTLSKSVKSNTIYWCGNVKYLDLKNLISDSLKKNSIQFFPSIPIKGMSVGIIIFSLWGCFKAVFEKANQDAEVQYIKNYFQIGDFKLTRRLLDIHDIPKDMRVVGSIKNTGTKTILYFKLRALTKNSEDIIIN